MKLSENALLTKEDFMNLLDPVKFAKHYMNIELYPEQVEIIKTALENSYTYILAHRQMGKSTAISVLALWFAINNANSNVLVFAPSREQAIQIIYRKIRDAVENNEKLLSFVADNAGKPFITKDLIRFQNGSQIKCFSTDRTANIRGWSGNFIILDESQDIADDVFYQKIMPMITAQKNPKVIQIGTPLLKKNSTHFYASYLEGKSGGKWKVLEYPVWKTTISKKNKDRILELKRLMPENEFKAEFELAWIRDENSYFSSSLVESSVEDYKIPTPVQGVAYVGIDFGKKADSTVVLVGDYRDQDVYIVDYLEIKDVPFNVQVQEIKKFLSKYNPVLVAVDSTGLGESLKDFLVQELPYQIEPVIFSQQNKANVLYPKIRLALTNKRLHIPSSLEQLVSQLLSLRYTYSSTGGLRIHAEKGAHDDYVDALALVLYRWSPTGETTDTIERVKLQFIDSVPTQQIHGYLKQRWDFEIN